MFQYLRRKIGIFLEELPKNKCNFAPQVLNALGGMSV
jgi:hypothetical protein